jgi:hypothetical protein
MPNRDLSDYRYPSDWLHCRRHGWRQARRVEAREQLMIKGPSSARSLVQLCDGQPGRHGLSGSPLCSRCTTLVSTHSVTTGGRVAS